MRRRGASGSCDSGRSPRPACCGARCARRKKGGSDLNLDIDGYLTSTEFLAQLAAFVAAIFNLLFQGVLGGVLGGP